MTAVRLSATGPVPGRVPGKNWTLTIERAEDVEIHRTLEGNMRVTFRVPTKTVEHIYLGGDQEFTPSRTELRPAEFTIDPTIDLVISTVDQAADPAPPIHWHPV